MNQPTLFAIAATTAEPLAFTLPVPPSLNNCYTNGRNGRRVMTAEGRAFKQQAILATRAAANRAGWEYVDGAMALELLIYFPNRQRRDISNAIKLAEDAIAEALGFDDCVIDRISVERAGIDPANPRCEVVVSVL